MNSATSDEDLEAMDDEAMAQIEEDVGEEHEALVEDYKKLPDDKTLFEDPDLDEEMLLVRQFIGQRKRTREK